MNSVAVVTGYVPIPDFPRSAEEYERLGKSLLSVTAAPVQLYRQSLDECWLSEHTRLPSLRPLTYEKADNPRKNSIAYHIVQHEKTAWILKAFDEHPHVDMFVWIDYGLFHRRDVTVDAINNFLERLEIQDEVVIPGCLEAPEMYPGLPDWRFCGAVLIVPRTRARQFHDAVRKVTLERISTRRHVTLEVNDWAEVERQKLVPIRWYKADHDVTMFTHYSAQENDMTDQRVFRPAFSPASCYILRNEAEEAYFASCGGAPEAPLIDWSTQFIKTGETFVDVGAHVGTWTQHFALRCKRVHAFEPQQSTYDRLCAGVDRAKLRNVSCHNVALGGNGVVDLQIISDDGGGSTLRHWRELGSVLATERVICTQLDEFVFENLGLIKIDAEGFELDILRGAAKTIETHRPKLLLEAWTHEWYARERERLIAHVTDLGYSVTPISGYPEMMLVQPSTREAVQVPEVVLPPAPATEPAAEEAPAPALLAAPPPVDLSVSRPLLGLVMIVRNEASRILEVLASYRPYINAWTILDTGSTDGTQTLIRNALACIPGVLHEEPFVDFATSRNRALELHGTQTIFTIMPNGDTLEGGVALVAFLETHVSDRAGAYRVRIAPGHYYHPLVMRTGAGWRYKWRTHECAIGPNQGAQIPGVTVKRDRGARTDAEWRARWERDLVLLNQDREADPTDPRPHFYLGQTHECLGQHDLALLCYLKRATMGGYFDEVYEAKFRIAAMKDELDHPWAEVQQAYLEAHELDPRRAEPLYAVSQYWYDKKVHSLARMFAAAAATMPIPPTDLFLDESVYTWKAADRASISSFYSGRMKSARDFAEQAVSFSPQDGRLRANRAFCAPSAAELFGSRNQAIEWSAPEGWQVSNPSITYDAVRGRFRCIVRTVNYTIVDGMYVTPPEDVVSVEDRWKGWQIIRTRNFLLDLDPDFRVTSAVEMSSKDDLPRTNYPVRGFEDARLFAWKESWWATATVCDLTEDGNREIALLQLNDAGEIVRVEPLRGPWSDRHQKNWMPAVQDGNHLSFVYATSLDGDVGSTTVFDIDATTHQIDPGKGAVYDHGQLRGGSQVVAVDGGWVALVHDVAISESRRMYLHRFVFFTTDLRLYSMTDLFYFDQRGIEFCAGLALQGSQLIASYSVNDGSAKLATFDLETVRQRLRTDFVI